MLGGQSGVGICRGIWVGAINLRVIRIEVDEATERVEKRESQELYNAVGG